MRKLFREKQGGTQISENQITQKTNVGKPNKININNEKPKRGRNIRNTDNQCSELQLQNKNCNKI